MKQHNLSENDRVLLEAMGISEAQVQEQMEMFRQGPHPILIEKPAIANDGIAVIGEKEKEELMEYYSHRCGELEIVKFVPASGAASRMFKTLQKAKNSPIDALSPDEMMFMEVFKEGLENQSFAFHRELAVELGQQGTDLDKELENRGMKRIIGALLDNPGLNYANLPKALIKFHSYADFTTTPIEEHLSEGIAYARDSEDKVRIHFTISPEFQERVKKYISGIIPRYQSQGVDFIIDFSEQKTSTNTIPLAEDNTIFRDANGRLVPWPAGHGALIENLNEIQADVVFIKNIDNVVPGHLQKETITYKKVLAGCLLKSQEKTFNYLKLLKNDGIEPQVLTDITTFAKESLNICFPGDFQSRPAHERREYLFKKLNRPIRVCGMVKNEGEPGGGPFWTRSQDGTLSLQIVETAQIDSSCPRSRQIMEQASHFNPVDLVCGIRDFTGKPFDLIDYRDPNTFFISSKSREGTPLKAIELPGLWNGAMAFWNTIFVEVPIATFNPVKTVNDLLRSSHQPPKK